jgi:hypothetical protein
MPATFTNKDLCYCLGYSAWDFDTRYSTHPIQIPNYADEDRTAIQALLDEIADIENQIKTNTADSMAESVGGLKVNFTRNIMLLQAEGHRKLTLLARLSGVPIKFDRFLARAPGEHSITPVVVRSYG